MESITILRPPGSNLSSCAYCISAAGRCAQSISKTRPSRCVILSASEGSLSGERSKARAQDDTREAASFDSQNVLFEMNWALRLATVPVFGEQIEKYLLSWMLANDLLVQCDTESWPIRQREEAIHHFGIAGRSSLDPVFGKVVEVFLDFEVGCSCREVECGGGGDRTAHIVRRDQHVIGFGPGSKLLCFEQAPKWVISGWIMSAAFLRAARFSGGTGSSIQEGLNGSSSRAISIAVTGLKRPCISTSSSASGPMASRTASTRATACNFSLRSS